MSLFTDPVTLTENTNDHIFSKRNDITGLKAGSYGSKWIESASAQAVDTHMNVKHDESSSTVRRRLLQVKSNATIADGTTYKPITGNFSLAHHPEHTDAQLQVVIDLVEAALAASGFNASFADGQS